jgi:soluble lytic murein transglycosylase-like protein
VPGRRAWIAAAAVLALLALPPARRLGGRAVDALREAVAAARAEAARERVAAAYAARYGISPALAADILDAAAAEGLDAELAFRLVRVESAFHERAESAAGAVGLTQLMPATARGMRPGITRDEMFGRETNLRLGFRYLGGLLRQYDGDTEEALHAYNRGMGTVARIRAAGGDPANGYAELVLGPKGASPVRRGAPPARGARTAPPDHELPPARLREAM